MARFGSPHEIGIRDLEPVPSITEKSLHMITPGLRRVAVLLCRLGDLLPVFVQSGDEGHVKPVHSLIPRDRVGGDRRISRAEMRRGVYVIDGRRKRIGSF